MAHVSQDTLEARGQARIGLISAMPFWLSMALIPLIWVSATYGGLWVLLLPAATWLLFSIIDSFAGLNERNEDTTADDAQLFWYRLVTFVWPPVQLVTIFGVLWYVTASGHLTTLELFGLFFGVGVISGTIGINYSHELMHQRPRFERELADILLAMVMYSHFRSEHLLVHHRYIGTPRDPVTARYNENFHRFFARVVMQCFVSAFRAERVKLSRKGLPWSHRSNPFWKYWALQLVFVVVSFVIAGWLGVVLFLFQAYVAILQLELVNYVEHYGLTRKHLGGGKYETVRPHHSWNAAHKASNWLLINLQRHSDHHFKPDRRFPLLQTYDEGTAPQLPHGYPIMTALALIPPIWRRVMNPRVRAWRRRHYPEITDWQAYNKALNPLPR